MDLNYLIVRNEDEKMLKKLLHLFKKYIEILLVVLNAIEKKYWKSGLIEHYWKKYWKVLKIRTYWTLLKKYWKILILIEPSIEKVLIIEHWLGQWNNRHCNRQRHDCSKSLTLGT